MRRILALLITVGLIILMVGAGFAAYFSDTEISNGAFTAGTLDLTLDGQNGANASITYSNMQPVHSQPNKTFEVENIGSISGFLDIEDVAVTSDENECWEPEIEAGDTTCDNPGPGMGELASLLDLRLMVDRNCDGWYQGTDTIIWQGKANEIPSHFDVNEPLAENGGHTCINLLINWFNQPDNNLAQSDSMTLDMKFELGQEEGQ